MQARREPLYSGFAMELPVQINVRQAVPFFRVTSMETSLRFYVDGLGFELKRKWTPKSDRHGSGEGKIRWCSLELGDAALMLSSIQTRQLSRFKVDAIIGIGSYFDAARSNPRNGRRSSRC
jgi:catechol 2,3-dioxygenase-like lactoylglutathione lyase family enzyme